MRASFTCDASRITLSEKTWAKKGNQKLKKGRKSRFKSAAEGPRSEANTTVHMLHMMVLTVHLVVHMAQLASIGWIGVR